MQQPRLDHPLLARAAEPSGILRTRRPDPTSSEPFEARTILAVARRRRWLIFAVVASAVAASLIVSSLQDERYRASAELLLGRPLDTMELTEAARANELRIIQSEVLADAVAEELGFDADISVDAVDVSDAVEITATHPDATTAAEIANTYAETYLSQRRARSLELLDERRTELRSRYDAVTAQLDTLTQPLTALETEIAGAGDEEQRQELEDLRQRLSDDIAAQRQSLVGQQATYAQQLNELLLTQSTLDSRSGEILSRADVPTTPYQPTPLRNALSALVLGGILALGLAFLRERLDDSLDDVGQVRDLLHLPVLGSVPRLGSSGTVLADDTHRVGDQAQLAEAFRMIRTSVSFIAVEQPIASIAVTSAEVGEGKSVTALNLARALAWEGRRVALVEVDLHRPALAARLDTGDTRGLADVLLQELPLEEAMTHPDGSGVSVLLAGGRPPNAAELLGSARMRRIQERLETDYDVVVYDLPPLLPVSDGLVMSKQVDAVVLVVSAKVSRVGRVTEAASMLQENGANVIGVVFNRAEARHASYGEA